jgi:hypothetical protein
MQFDDFSRLPSEPPSLQSLNAHQRRAFLVCPDRRSFIQSMSHEAARRVTGNAVPAHPYDGGLYAYTFPPGRFASAAHSIPCKSYYHIGRDAAPPPPRIPASRVYSPVPSTYRDVGSTKKSLEPDLCRPSSRSSGFIDVDENQYVDVEERWRGSRSPRSGARRYRLHATEAQ